MNARIALIVVAVLFLLSSSSMAQTTEQKALQPMVGRWQVEIDLKATPISQATKATGTEDCEWFANRHVVCRSEAKGTTGMYSQMRTLSYIPAQKQYAAYTIDSLGTALIAYGTVAGHVDVHDPVGVHDPLDAEGRRPLVQRARRVCGP